MDINKIKVGDTYKFKDNIGLSYGSGQKFKVTGIITSTNTLHIEFIDYGDTKRYHIEWHVWREAVDMTPWQGSRLVFNFM